MCIIESPFGGTNCVIYIENLLQKFHSVMLLTTLVSAINVNAHSILKQIAKKNRSDIDTLHQDVDSVFMVFVFLVVWQPLEVFTST